MNEAALKKGEALFRQECRFLTGAASVDGFPPPGPGEIAFAGRSNVGKSSLINALTGRKTLARTSNTPGRTQQINFFDLGGRMQLVDLPGYGYADAPEGFSDAWNALVRAYLRQRPTLKRVCLLTDARHGFKPSDREMMNLLAEVRVPYLVILTKTDKLTKSQLAIAQAAANKEADAPVYAISAAKKEGIPDLRAFLAQDIM
jgi:GTP-binding protein